MAGDTLLYVSTHEFGQLEHAHLRFAIEHRLEFVVGVDLRRFGGILELVRPDLIPETELTFFGQFGASDGCRTHHGGKLTNINRRLDPDPRHPLNCDDLYGKAAPAGVQARSRAARIVSRQRTVVASSASRAGTSTFSDSDNFNSATAAVIRCASTASQRQASSASVCQRVRWAASTTRRRTHPGSRTHRSCAWWQQTGGDWKVSSSPTGRPARLHAAVVARHAEIFFFANAALLSRAMCGRAGAVRFVGTKRISTLWSRAVAMRLSIANEWPS